MPSQNISRATKPCRSNNRSNLQQSRRRLKKTLVKKLWEYNIKCGSDVYLVIADHMGDDVGRFFTTKFMVDQQLTEGFPPSEKSLKLSSRKANNIRKLPKVRKALESYRTGPTCDEPRDTGVSWTQWMQAERGSFTRYAAQLRGSSLLG
ncbi:hypothetical protein ACJ73_01771 [Blastomyces percursus]|uniref:MADS-box domain-containing protein n=1 Tax=Blastomyces percursus TaxID=1658174 RepID=A0A1J9QFG8_9EURO|nr:hypothetical protein ACJ73_01771 [Blastomyces percursus]